MANGKKMWRCRLCGHEQPVGENNNICGNPSCGADLSLYGDRFTAAESGSSSKKAFQGKPLIFAAGVAAAVLAVLFLAVMILGSRGTPAPGETQEPAGQETPAPQTTEPPAAEPTNAVPAPDPTQEPTQEPPMPVNQTDIPDFLAFSNGWSHEVEEKRQPDGSVQDRYYAYYGDAGDILVSEYVNLLSDSGAYPFTLLETMSVSVGTESRTYYAFQYTGDTYASGFSLTVTHNDGEYTTARSNLVLTDRRTAYGGGELKLTYASELTPADCSARTSYIQNGSCTLQDFQPFANGLVQDPQIQDTGSAWEYTYALDSGEAMEAADQYLNLLSSCAYPYYFLEAGGGFASFEQFGPDRFLGHFAMEGSSRENAVVYAGITTAGGSRSLTLYLSKGIVLEDGGFRSDVSPSYPAQIPDFAAFSNGWAHELPGRESGAGSPCEKHYEYTDDAGNGMIPEFLDLVMGSYPFDFVQRKVISDGSRYWMFYLFSFKDSSQTTAFSRTFEAAGETYEANNVNLVLMDRRNQETQGGILTVVYSPELSLDSSCSKTSYDFSGPYTLQDFQSFSGGSVDTVDTYDGEYSRTYLYHLDTQEAQDAAQEYISFLSDCFYPYYVNQLGTHTSGSSTFRFTCLEQFGPQRTITHFVMADSSGEVYTEDTVLYVRMMDDVGLAVVVSHDITLTDDGFRAGQTG